MFDDILGNKEDVVDFNTFKEARRAMWETLKADPDFLRAYTDNIAMRLFDEQNWADKEGDKLDFRDKDIRDRIALDLMELIFG